MGVLGRRCEGKRVWLELQGVGNMVDKKKKKGGVAIVIAVGPKMPKKPEDTSKPDEDMKKAFDTAFDVLKKKINHFMDITQTNIIERVD